MIGQEAVGITVGGIGRAPAQPDVMSVDVGISLLAVTVAEGRASAEEKSNDVISALHERGVAPGEIRTIRYSISPEYDQRDGELRGYRVTNEIRISIRDLATAGELIDVAAESGGDDVTVNNVEFSVEDESPALAAARDTAWRDVLGRAEHLAHLAGRSLGPLVSIAESNGPPGPSPLPRMALAEASPIDAGTTTVSVFLSARFALD